MKNIIAPNLMLLLAVLAFSCTSSNTALRSTESDDLYYASTDKTTSPEMVSTVSQSIPVTNEAGSPEYEIANPEYSGSESGQNAVANGYDYYDNDRSYSRNYSRGRFRDYNYYGYDPFYSPYYSPFGYSAAYCYNLYDPFWYPYCYPAGVSISIGFGYGYGYPGYYGYGYPGYGYRGYGGYGGYGGYYNGFYDGYYAGGYGSGYRRNVSYGPRTNRSSIPVGTSGGGGIPGRSGGRVAQTNDPGRIAAPAGRPRRIAQPGTDAPGRINQQVNTEQQIQSGREGDVRPGRPQRDAQNVQPENYQFQNPTPPTIEYSRPTRGRDAAVPSQPNVAPQNDVSPAPIQQPSRPQRSESRQNNVQSQPSQPVRENSSRPAQSGGQFNNAPSRGMSPGGGNGGSMGGGSMGRPRR